MTARLETDETQRRTLLADVSHELRTPLTVITGSLEAMLDGVHPLDREHLEPILDETRVLERLVEDLRTVTLSEAGTLPLHPEPTDPDVIVGEVVRAFGPAAEAAGVALVTEVTGDLPIIEIDPVRIREVLTNLVANALRHTPQGGTVAIGGGVTADAVTLTVRDTGPGIEPALLPHVFERFVRGAVPTARAWGWRSAADSWRRTAVRSRWSHRPATGPHSGSSCPGPATREQSRRGPDDGRERARLTAW